MVLADRIAWAREEAGMTQVDLAEAVGVHAGTVGRWEAGDCNIPAARVRRIANATGVSVLFLQGNTDDPHEGVDPPPEMEVPPKASPALGRAVVPRGLVDVMLALAEQLTPEEFAQLERHFVGDGATSPDCYQWTPGDWLNMVLELRGAPAPLGPPLSP